MKQDVKRKWVRALRSGKYRRGRGQFKAEHGAYCCLGVLCEVMGQEYDPEDAALPNGFRDLIGLSGFAESALIDLNDGGWDEVDQDHFGDAPNGYRGADRGASFRVIADWISKHA